MNAAAEKVTEIKKPEPLFDLPAAPAGLVEVRTKLSAAEIKLEELYAETSRVIDEREAYDDEIDRLEVQQKEKVSRLASTQGVDRKKVHEAIDVIRSKIMKAEALMRRSDDMIDSLEQSSVKMEMQVEDLTGRMRDQVTNYKRSLLARVSPGIKADIRDLLQKLIACHVLIGFPLKIDVMLREILDHRECDRLAARLGQEIGEVLK